MSNALFPVLQGQNWPRGKTPMFNTQVQTSSSLRNWRVARAAYPVYKIKVGYEYLSKADFELMAGFFKDRRGRGDTFLFDDRDDRLHNDTATPQTFAVGNGVTRKFQLVRQLAGVIEPIGKVNGTPTVRIASAGTGAYTLDDYGSITFTTAPAASAVLDWQGAFYWRCAFIKDEQDFDEFMRHFWQARTVEFMTDKA